VYVAEIIPKGKIIEIKEQKIRWYSQEWIEYYVKMPRHGYYYYQYICRCAFYVKRIHYPLFQASAVMLMRSALFWGITQRRVVILYRRFGTTYRSNLEGSWTSGPYKMGQIRCPETSVKDYHSTLRYTSEERTSQDPLCLV
jgi:hypothetical protein